MVKKYFYESRVRIHETFAMLRGKYPRAHTKGRMARQRNICRNNNGYTIIEMMGAIFVFLVGVVAVMTLISATLRALRAGEGRLTAIYLAQEGIELVRNIRDENWINGRSWRTGADTFCNIPPAPSGNTTCTYILDDTLINPNGYIVDYYSGGLGANVDVALCYYTDDGRADSNRPIGFMHDIAGACSTYPGGIPTSYKRVIYFNKLSDGELKLRSVVSWNAAGAVSVMELTEHLVDWNKQEAIGG